VQNDESKDYICSQCLNIGAPKRIKRGTRGMEVLLWSLFPLGVPYTIWRMLTKYNGCKQCSSTEIVLLASSYGQKLLMRYDREVLGVDTSKLYNLSANEPKPQNPTPDEIKNNESKNIDNQLATKNVADINNEVLPQQKTSEISASASTRRDPNVKYTPPEDW
jgi:hypothetical protein